MTLSHGEAFQISKSECFGQYKKSDHLCRKLCALRLGCVIENNRIEHIEIIEDLIGNDGLIIKI